MGAKLVLLFFHPHKKWLRCWFVSRCVVRLLKVCNVVCMIGIPNLVNLSSRGLLCVLVVTEIGL